MRRHRVLQFLALVLGIYLGLAPSVSRAGLLTLQESSPDIMGDSGLAPVNPQNASAFDLLSYFVSSGEFTSTGPALSITENNGLFAFINSGMITIDLYVDSSGNFFSSGTGVTVTGDIDIGNTDVSGTLLQGTITAFGAEPAGPATWSANGLFTISYGLLTQTQGTLPALFTVGQQAGFTVSSEYSYGGNSNPGESLFLGDFTQDFYGTSDKPEVFNLVPVPPTLQLILLGGGLLAGARFFKERRLAGLPMGLLNPCGWRLAVCASGSCCARVVPRPAWLRRAGSRCP
jgi:hypothetical protein